MKYVLFRSVFFWVLMITSNLCRPLKKSSPRLQPRDNRFCRNPSVRSSWYTFNPQQKQAYQDAVKCLVNAPSKMKYPGAVSRYDDLVAIHQLQSDYPHGKDLLHVTARFLFWHRLYIYLFELLLRVECNYTGNLPYWDEKVDAGNFQNSVYIQDFGGVGNEYGYVVDGQFGYQIVNLGPGTENRRRYLRRRINETASAFASQEHYDLLMSQESFAGFMQVIRNFQHLSAHVGMSGDMGNVQTAPVDLAFMGHHGYLDFVWWKWQIANPDARVFDIRDVGYETQGPPFTPANWYTKLTFLGLADDVPMYAAADTTGGFLCYVYE